MTSQEKTFLHLLYTRYWENIQGLVWGCHDLELVRAEAFIEAAELFIKTYKVPRDEVNQLKETLKPCK